MKKTLCLFLALLLCLLCACAPAAPDANAAQTQVTPTPVQPAVPLPAVTPCEECGSSNPDVPTWAASAAASADIAAKRASIPEDIAAGVYANFSMDNYLPFRHYAGSGEREDYMAIITFEYKMDNYTKYQLTYLSCTCRAASEDVQQMLYVELNNNAPSAEEATIRNIHYDFWGDPDPIPENGITSQQYDAEFLSFLQYKSKAEIDAMTHLRTIPDPPAVERSGESVPFVDAYTGATVSVNNTLFVLQALFAYHADKYYGA